MVNVNGSAKTKSIYLKIKKIKTIIFLIYQHNKIHILHQPNHKMDSVKTTNVPYKTKPKTSCIFQVHENSKDEHLQSTTRLMEIRRIIQKSKNKNYTPKLFTIKETRVYSFK